jgi:predicted cobalt transporter CbtA
MILRTLLLMFVLHAPARADNPRYRRAGAVVTGLGVAAMLASSALYFSGAASTFDHGMFGSLPSNVSAGIGAFTLYAGSEVLLSSGMPLLLANNPDGEPRPAMMAGGAVLTCLGVSTMLAGVAISIASSNHPYSSDPVAQQADDQAAARQGWAGMGTTVLGNAVFAIGLPLLVEGFGKKRVQARNGALVF